LLAVCQELRVHSSLVPRIATPFGGGIGRTGAVCGALVGGTMAIGLVYGRKAPVQSRDRAYGLAEELRSRFEEEMGTVSCRELTGVDLTTEEGRQQFHDSNVSERVCRRARAVAYRAAMDLLDREEGERGRSRGRRRVGASWLGSTT
jgi:C_GCAxxG_C_C family probable redox protein